MRNHTTAVHRAQDVTLLASRLRAGAPMGVMPESTARPAVSAAQFLSYSYSGLNRPQRFTHVSIRKTKCISNNGLKNAKGLAQSLPCWWTLGTTLLKRAFEANDNTPRLQQLHY